MKLLSTIAAQGHEIGFEFMSRGAPNAGTRKHVACTLEELAGT